MSPHTLKNLIEGGPLSENMLFRLRNSLEYALQHPGISVMRDENDVYFGDWRKTNTAEIQAAISQVANRLIYLKRVVETSNSLNGPETPIDRIQIAQLIALLEATLSALKAPFVEKQQTAGVIGYVKKLGKKVLEKKVENAVSSAIDQVVDAGSDLLDKLADAPGISDLGGIIT